MIHSLGLQSQLLLFFCFLSLSFALRADVNDTQLQIQTPCTTLSPEPLAPLPEKKSYREVPSAPNALLTQKGSAADKPVAVYLTWQHSPLTTMTIQWISSLESLSDSIEYQQSGTKKWLRAVASHFPFPENFPGLIHRVEISGLKPATEYIFRIGKQEKIYKFKTMPTDLNKPLRFVVGGDIYHDLIEFVKETNIQAAKTNPDFALLGGDIAYTSEKESEIPENSDRWITWLINWSETMITSDGRLIPMITAIGNHDTLGRYTQSPKQAPFYYALFPTPDNREYRVIDFGKFLSIFVLDSGHTHLISGEQAKWLEDELKSRNDIMHKFALYHAGAYPSVRQMDSKMSPIIRDYWVPLFEKYGLNAAFEHHDHAYKRSVRIKDDKADPKGVLYIGDGAWGVSEPRHPKVQGEQWFLAKTAAERHFILVTIEKGKRKFEAINSKGQQFDSYEIKD
ncbi:MAG: metallophosphoesterase family protein [Parachlamydiaceae bacterium]|nr:metallophosphoesterase family protein [Parachlamydiaceae bacterium]